MILSTLAPTDARCLVSECGRALTHRTSAYGGRELPICLGHSPRMHVATRRVVGALERAGFALVEKFATYRCGACGTCSTATRALEHEVDGADCRALQAERLHKARG